MQASGWWNDLWHRSDLDELEFENVFNCGWGMVLVVDKRSLEDLRKLDDAQVIGEVIEK